MTTLENILRTAQHWQRMFAIKELPAAFTIKTCKTKDATYIRMELYHDDKYLSCIYFDNSSVEKATNYLAQIQQLYNNLTN